MQRSATGWKIINRKFAAFSSTLNTQCETLRRSTKESSKQIRALKRTLAKLHRKLWDTQQRNKTACSNPAAAQRQRQTISICSDKFYTYMYTYSLLLWWWNLPLCLCRPKPLIKWESRDGIWMPCCTIYITIVVNLCFFNLELSLKITEKHFY